MAEKTSFVQGVCPVCKSQINLPAGQEHAFCPACGASILAADVEREAQEQRQSAQPATKSEETSSNKPTETGIKPSNNPETKAGPESNITPTSFFGSSPETVFGPLKKTYDTPFLSQWKTDTVFSVLGLLLRCMIIWTIANLSGFQHIMSEALATGTLTLTDEYILGASLFDVTCAGIALAMVPRRFVADYEGKNYLVSLYNTLVGGLVFGLWWNKRLTKKTPGFSHLVFFLFLATNGFTNLAMLMMA